MEVKIQLHTTTHQGNISSEDIIITEAQDNHPNPRMGFFQKFLRGVLCKHYPALHCGEEFKDSTLNCVFTVQHMHVTMDNIHAGEKRVILTGILRD